MEHAFRLFNAIKHDQKVMINPPNMTHNNFALDTDFVLPLKKFVRSLDDQDKSIKEENMALSTKDSKLWVAPQHQTNAFGFNTKGTLLPDLSKLIVFKRMI